MRESRRAKDYDSQLVNYKGCIEIGARQRDAYKENHRALVATMVTELGAVK